MSFVDAHGTERLLARLQGDYVYGARFDPEGRRLLFLERRRGFWNERFDLWIVDLERGSVESIALPPES